jgi:beta-glucanase (GH16 family)
MSRATLTLGLVALAALGVAASQASKGRDASARPRLILREEFAGTGVDRRVWSTCHWWGDGGCTIASNGELEWYLARQVHVRGGRLQLVAMRRGVRGADGRRYRFVSGMISSGPPPGSRKPKFSFRYGRVEARARVPAGDGLWSAFWLLPANRASKPEIDVMEILGHDPATVEMHVHYRGPDGRPRARGTQSRLLPLASGWHRFGIDWRPRSLAWIVDGVERWRVEGRAVPRRRMYLVANLAVGGDWPGPPSPSTRFPRALEIDYVRVWQ